VHEVTCVGIIVADVIAKTVDNLPPEGKLDLIGQLELHLGGCASNTAVDLEKIGVKTAVIGRVGEDGFGAFVINEMNRNGVDAGGIKVSKTSKTSASVVLVHSNGERSFLHCLGANSDFSIDDLDFSIILNSKILFIAGALLMPKFDGNPSSEVLKKAQGAGITTVMDTAWDSKGKWMKLIEPCLPYLDYFIPSLEEAEMISGKNQPVEIADLFLHAGVKTVVIKLGSKGCFIKNKIDRTQCIRILIYSSLCIEIHVTLTCFFFLAIILSKSLILSSNSSLYRSLNSSHFSVSSRDHSPIILVSTS